jgi:hypothetical protein
MDFWIVLFFAVLVSYGCVMDSGDGIHIRGESSDLRLDIDENANYYNVSGTKELGRVNGSVGSLDLGSTSINKHPLLAVKAGELCQNLADRGLKSPQLDLKESKIDSEIPANHSVGDIDLTITNLEGEVIGNCDKNITGQSQLNFRGKYESYN